MNDLNVHNYKGNSLDESIINNKVKEISDYKSLYNAKNSQREILMEQRKKLLSKMKTLETRLENISNEKALLEESSKKARDMAKKIFEELSTDALRAVFEDDRHVEINIESKAGQPVADLFVVNKGVDTNPAEEDAGGVADMVSVPIFLSLSDLLAKNVAPIFLDEPNKYVSEEYSERISMFLRSICEYTERQMFLVTHDDMLKFVGDVCYRIVMVDDCSVATLIS